MNAKGGWRVAGGDSLVTYGDDAGGLVSVIGP